MRIERTKNATRNILFGVLLKIYQLFVPFLLRTAMIYFLGVQYLGLSSLFTSILQVLNLAEIGVGSAMVYSMYKPIAEDNVTEICALMKLYRIYYRTIGLIILVIGLILTPFIPKLISGDVPQDINIYVLYLMNLMATVCSYWLFAYKSCLLYANQRVDVISKVTLITSTIQYFLQFCVLYLFRNYYGYLLIVLLIQIVTNIVTAMIVSKMYPQYQARGKLEKVKIHEINNRIKDLFTSKVGAVILNSADTIVISSFLGLKVLAVYQNYYFIMTSVIGVITTFFTACTAGIGNSVIVETEEKNFNDLKKFTLLVSWIAGFCACCFVCLYQPFIKLWVGESLMLDFRAVLCFGLYYYVYEINQLLNTYKDAAGIWHEDRYRPLITALTNLGMNLIMVQFWGIYGVLLSTVLSILIVGMPWLLHNLFSTLFEKEMLFSYLRKLFFYTVVSGMVCFSCYMICQLVTGDSIICLVIKMAICCIVPNILFLCLYFKQTEFKQCIIMIDNMTKRRFHLKRVFNLE